jgi:hypothetical protein
VTAIDDVLATHREHQAGWTFLGASLKDRVREVISRELIALRWSNEIFRKYLGEQRKLENIPPYWENLIALYVLEGKPASGLEGYSGSEILDRIQSPQRRLIWRLIITMPTPLAHKVLSFWWGNSLPKKWVKSLFIFDE